MIPTGPTAHEVLLQTKRRPVRDSTYKGRQPPCRG